MNLVKGFALIVAGFVGGFFSTSFVLEDSVDKTLQIHKDIQDIAAEAFLASNETRIYELRASIQISEVLLQSYRDGTDIKNVLYSHIAEYKEELAVQKEMEPHLSDNASEILQEIEDKILKLEEDVEFYIGPL